jgi:hypothetical protein
VRTRDDEIIAGRVQHRERRRFQRQEPPVVRHGYTCEPSLSDPPRDLVQIDELPGHQPRNDIRLGKETENLADDPLRPRPGHEPVVNDENLQVSELFHSDARRDRCAPTCNRLISGWEALGA